MADISRIQIESGTYDIKDEIARQKLSKSALFFDNIASLKNATDLENGQIVETLGFYTKNDGGAATYVISNESLIADESFIIELQNNLFAKLQYNAKINIKQLGARSQDKENNKYDIADYIKRYLNFLLTVTDRYTLYIPSRSILLFINNN